MVKKIILSLFLLVPVLMFAQPSRTTNLKLNLYQAHIDTIKAGSITDSSTANWGLNGNFLRIDALYNKYIDIFRDSLRAFKYARFTNGMLLNGTTANQLILTNGRLDIWGTQSRALTINPYSPYGAGNTSALTFVDVTSAHYIGFKAPDAVTSNLIFTLPRGDSTAGYVLGTSGAGVLGWYNPALFTVDNVKWSSLTNPTERLNLEMLYTTTLTFGSLGSDSSAFKIAGVAADGSDSYLLDVQTGASGSLNSPIRFTARGTSNGVKMDYTGKLSYIGSGVIDANKYKGNSTVAITDGGSGQTSANAALNAFLPSQTSNAGKYLNTDATNTSWMFIPITKGYEADNWSTSDSTIFWGVPTSLTIDSIYAYEVGGSACVINIHRNRASTITYLLSSNYTVTTSWAKANTIQNNTLLVGDQIAFVQKSVTTAATKLVVQLFGHLTQ